MIRNISILLVMSSLLFISCSGENGEKIFTGIVEGTTVQVPAITGGKILKLFADEGDRVKTNNMLAQVDTVELTYQKDRLEGALEEINVQREVALTSLNQAKTNLRYVREKYQRFLELHKKESVPQQTVDDLKNKLESAESGYQTALQQFQNIAAKKKQVNAQLNSIQKKIKDATITAPISGTITNKYYETGEAIPPLSPVFEIIELEQVWVKIYLAETMLPETKIGQVVKIVPDGSQKTLDGEISWISPEAEFTPKTILTPETRTSLVYAVKVKIQNEEQLLKQGMPVEVRF